MNDNSVRASKIISGAFVALCITTSIAYFAIPGRLEGFVHVAQWLRAMFGL
jgi:hypothetical protein